MPKTQTFAVVAAIVAAVTIIIGVAITQTDDTIEIITDTPDANATENEIIEQKLEEIEKKKQDSIEKILESEYDPTRPREWQKSGPFEIDRKAYYLGEKIFLRIGALQFEDKGQVAFLKLLNATHYEVYDTIPFDGVNKPAFNYYIDPQLSKARKICSVEDIIGEWTVVFRGTDYPNLKFTIINQTIPGEEDRYFNPVC